MATVQFKDYYKTLGVPRDADERAIRSAYRKLARTHHPDVNPGDTAAEERFKEINEAHEVLTDSAKRKLYDRYGEEWERFREAGFTGDEPAGRAPSSGGFDTSDFGAWFASREGQTNQDWTVFDVGDERDGGGFSDFFQVLFGNRSQRGGATTMRRRPRKGEDLEVAVDLSLDEAFRGAKRMLRFEAPEVCSTCNGTGLARNAPCPTCDGTGTVTRSRTLEVSVPAGVATGSRVRVAGQGGPGRDGGPNGDVFLRVKVRPDARFERINDDLRTDVSVPLWTALLGGETEVTTPTGRVALRIPAGTQPGKVFRLRGQGMPKLKGGSRGDLLARVRVELPTNLSDEERSLVERWKALRS